jgi:hypothetical protein
MSHRIPCRSHVLTLTLALAVSACADAPTATQPRPVPPNLGVTKFWETLATTRWNERATNLLQVHGAPSNGQAWASRLLTYLSLAQYRAALAATSPEHRHTHPSISAAVARASVTVLSDFFSWKAGVSASLSAQIAADQGAPMWPGEQNQDVAAGEAIGLAVAQAVLAEARADGYLSVAAPNIDGAWVPNGAIVRSLWGATPFFIDADAVYEIDPEDITICARSPARARRSAHERQSSSHSRTSGTRRLRQARLRPVTGTGSPPS